MINQTCAYLDYNATAPVRPAVIDAMTAVMATVGNPSSVHGAGRAVRARIEAARGSVAALVGAPARSVFFTSGGTEANNLAFRVKGVKRLIVSAVEHDSVRAAAEAFDGPVHWLDVDGNGHPDLAQLAALLGASPDRALVSVMLANNETGVIMPVADVVGLAREHGALVHTDAVQAVGRMPVDMTALGVDLLSLSAHKLGGPQGVGALVMREGVELVPLIRGGGQEQRRRAGTENVPGIVGLGAAADAAAEDLQDMDRVAALRQRLEAGIRAEIPNAVMIGADVARLPTTLCVAVPGVDSDKQIMALDLEGVCVSAGSACSSGKVTPSHVLAAMGAGENLARSAIRVSLGWASTDLDVDRFLDVWPRFIARMQDRKDMAKVGAAS